MTSIGTVNRIHWTNDEKTEVILCGTQNEIKPIKLPSISIGGNEISLSTTAKNLGVVFDNCLTMDQHINGVAKAINFDLFRISRMKKYLPTEMLNTVVCALILSRLDYCNSLLAGLPDVRLGKLQRLQNRAARLVLGTGICDGSSSKELLRKLHWLPIKARIDYKIALICFNALHERSPSYIQELIIPYSPARQLRSTGKCLLQVPKSRLKQSGDRAFSRIGPIVWNALPDSVKSAANIADYKKKLKTHLFVKYLG